MLGRMRVKSRVLPGLLAVLAALAAGQGCSEKAGGTRYPNSRPDTYISKGPSEANPNYYIVEMFWYGTDTDGDVDHYDVAVVRNISRESPVVLDSLDWMSTRANDSTFVMPADSCCYGEPGDGDPYLAISYWGIFVRAVDNNGSADLSPANVFFMAANAIPRVEITAPPDSAAESRLCTRPYFEWAGSDPDGDRTALQYKYIALPEGVSDALWGGGLPPFDYEGSGGDNAAPEVGRWSEWVPADCTYVNDIDLSEFRVGSEREDEVIFAVTVMDEGRAALPAGLFDTYNEGKNVVTLTVETAGCAVPAVIESDRLGVVKEVECGGPQDSPPVMFSGSGLYFSFYAAEDRAASRLADAYRYYFDEPDGPGSSWNLWTQVDPLRVQGADPEWRAIWPAAGPRYFPGVGEHVFQVQILDRGRDTTCAELRFDVLDGPAGRPRNILLVDDNRDLWWQGGTVPDFEQQEFEMWSDILEGYDWQEWDTGADFSDAVPPALAGGATTVIWSVDQGDVVAPHLLEVCSERGNYLFSYVEAGGNLIIIGRSPVYCTMYAYDGSPDPAARAGVTGIEFEPLELDEQHSFGHFMYDIFGIRYMLAYGAPQPVYVTAMEPCPGYEEWGAVNVRPPDDVGGWPGYFTGAFLVTLVRPGEDVHRFYGIRSLANPADPETAWVETVDCYSTPAIYVEGGSGRGYAAYINLPAWWFDRDDIKALVRGLLEMFGE
jgi:hypothetical protein